MSSVRSLCLARPCGSQQGLPVLPFQDVMPPQMHSLQPSTCRQCIECWLLLQSATTSPTIKIYMRSAHSFPYSCPHHYFVRCSCAHWCCAHQALFFLVCFEDILSDQHLKMLFPDTVLCPHAVRHRQSRRHQGELLQP